MAYKKALSTFVATAGGLEATIGAGIFVLGRKAIAIAVVYSIIAFVMAGIMALFVTLGMEELTIKTDYPVKGIEYKKVAKTRPFR